MKLQTRLKRVFSQLFLVAILFSSVQAIGQVDSVSTDDLFNMSFDDLMKIEVTVSSTKSLSVFNTPSTVTLIDSEMLDKYGFLSLADALAAVAGIDIMQTIIDKNVATSRGILQNFYANKVLIMINNVPTWQPIYGDGHLERIDLNDVEQIEVLKGPASVLYGSNAYSGVINIKLKNPDKTRVSSSGYIGYPNIGGASLNVMHKNKDFSVLVGANAWFEDRQDYEFEGRQGALYNGDSVFMYSETYNIRNLTMNLSYKQHSLLINNFGFYHSYLGADPSYISGGGLLVENNGTLINYCYNKRFNDKLDLMGNISFDYFKRRFPLSYDRQIMIYLAAYRSFGDIKLNYQISDKFKLEIGSGIDNRSSNGHDTRDGISDTLIRHNLHHDHDVIEWSLFGQLNYTQKWFSVLAGTRYTWNEHFGGNVSSRVSGLVYLGEQQSIKLIYGQSFRVPTMFELFFNHSTVIGNQNLKPETSTSYELAYLVGLNHIYIQALGFYASYNDLIQRITLPSGPPSIYQNVNSFEGYGVEAEFRYQNPKLFNGFVNYNYLAGTNEKIDNNYRYVPDHTISVGVNKTFGHWSISTTGRYISEAQGNLDIIPAQFLLNAQLVFSHLNKKNKFSHALIVKNATGSDMLTAEYIRQTSNINDIATTGYGTRIIYKFTFKY